MPRKVTKTKESRSNKTNLPLHQNKRGYSLQADSFTTKIENNLQNQSKISFVLGALIVLVVGILVFNYFNKSEPDLGPAQQTEQAREQDVTPDSLPGKYTVKQDDTLFDIADKYYKDGYKFTKIANANNLTNPDLLEPGQVLAIPKVEIATNPSTQLASADINVTPNAPDTQWGPKIEGNTYTVQEDDWLSKIAGRAYGDIFTFDKIAAANNLSNPDLIEPGMVLTIPR